MRKIPAWEDTHRQADRGQVRVGRSGGGASMLSDEWRWLSQWLGTIPAGFGGIGGAQLRMVVGETDSGCQAEGQ